MFENCSASYGRNNFTEAQTRVDFHSRETRPKANTEEIMNFFNKMAGKAFLPALALAAASIAAPAAADSNEPIKIPIKNWSSQIVMAHVIGGMFESQGN